MSLMDQEIDLGRSDDSAPMISSVVRSWSEVMRTTCKVYSSKSSARKAASVL